MPSSTTARRWVAGAALVALAGAAGCASPAAPVAAAPAAPAAPVAAAAQPAAEPEGEAEAPAPTRIRVGSIEVDAEVVPVGVDDAGLMEVPEDVTTIGWYRYGATPGEDGSAVLSGHVDDKVQGPGAFFDLVRTETGDTVEVDAEDGTTLTYRVDSVQNFGKEELPLEEVFQRSGTPRLVLITCGGPFDRAAGSYVENIVVTAVPV